MTIAIIISTHGSVSTKLLQTTEMIIGKQKNVECVDLLPNENTDTLIEKYKQKLSNLNLNFGVLFLVDMWGGTPFNAAQQIVLNQKNYNIITGINIPMLIEVFIEKDNIYSIQELTHIALRSGSESIKSIKYALPETETILNTSAQHSQPYNITSNYNNNKDTSQHKTMTICLARIDDRLIHGQVVTGWAKEYNINRIIVINDDIAKDIIRKNLLNQVTPPGITAHIISIEKAIRVYHNTKYKKDKVIMLFTNPTDVLRLIENGVPIISINIGGMSFQHGKKQIHNTISVNATDIAAFKKLDQLKIELEIRKVPSDTPLKLMKLIEHMT